MEHSETTSKLGVFPVIERIAMQDAPSSVDPKRKLKGMLARIFSDTTVEDAERNELKAYLTSGALGVEDVKAVFEDFVTTTWKITMADGVVTDVEKARLRNIVTELGIAKEMLPAEWAAIVDNG
jgi:hypothetical protein